MRMFAVGLLLASGCNQIFGLHDDLHPRDGMVDIYFKDAPYWSMQLTWQVVDAPNAAVTYPPIAGAKVEIGSIDPTETPLHALDIDANGNFLVPTEVPNSLYRLVYTVDSLPTEIQSRLHTGHFVVPMVGRIDREPTPSHALITFDPQPSPGVLPQARLMTVGLWTSADPPGAQINTPYDWDYQQYAISQAGLQGSLRADKGDLEVVTQLSGAGDVISFGTMSVDHLLPNGMGATTAASTWVTPAKTMVKFQAADVSGVLDPNARLMQAIFNAPASSISTEWGGVIPDATMPNFIQPNPGGLDGFQLAPLSTNGSSSPHAFANPFAALANLKPAALARNTSSRTTASGATLTSGFQSIGILPFPSSNDLSYRVALAHNPEVTLTPEAGGAMATTVYGLDDTLVVHFMGAKLVDLTFGTEVPPTSVDDCIATLYRITGTTVTPVRRLLLQQPPTTLEPFRLDASIFVEGTTYTFGIVCRLGQTGIAIGDYSLVSYPYQTSTRYTTTFTVTL